MYVPSQKILKKYADVLIKFALGSGKGIKKGETVFLQIPESSKAMLNPLVESVLEAGGNPLIHYTPEGTDRWLSVDKVFLQKANDAQIAYLPKNILLGRVFDCDHFVSMISTNNMQELKGVDSKKIMVRQTAIKFYKDARDAKENKGKLTWTLALFGTPAMAQEAGLTQRQYWNQIIKACFLDEANPIKKWQNIFTQQTSVKAKLNSLAIETLHVKGDNVDLTIKLGMGRKWLGGSGRNIPSFELFTSPDYRGTNGSVYFNQPLYRYGNLVEGIKLEFKNGQVTKVTAKKNARIVEEMIKVKGANQIGEFSLTDKRFSRITKFMAETLFDENIGGTFGNFHIALGSAYKDAYTGNPDKVTPSQWQKLGYNDSAVHTDIISTEDRVVTATLADGAKKVIYKNGQFVF